ncbi:hypothetical protein BpHYR1_016660 [Brachionus plicatilis]|uniref:Uncharacterized protein n=1 Tax=Brachionus plicatilis TaxID=10195 RepID=A0A3M7QBL0_BRAPC|nr:hypothetical protein BpHYR1_016660 [Brachionus plicatilis]
MFEIFLKTSINYLKKISKQNEDFLRNIFIPTLDSKMFLIKKTLKKNDEKDGLHARKSQELNTRQNTSNTIMKEHKV